VTKLNKKDIRKIKYFKVVSKNQVLISYRNSEAREIIEGKITRRKLHFPEDLNLQLKGFSF